MAAKDKARRFHALPRRQRIAARAILIRGLRHEALDMDIKVRRGGAVDEYAREAIRTILRRLNYHQDMDRADEFQFRGTDMADDRPTQLRVIEGSQEEVQEELFQAPPPRAA